MDRQNIVALPHDRLREKSAKITTFDETTKHLVHDMIAAGLDWEDNRDHELCVGLAAVQVDIHKQVVILRTDQEDKSNRDFTPLINPKIIRTSGKPEYDYEGCLSVKDIYGLVPRYPKIKIKAQDLDGQEFRLTADGFLARLIQHEIDHVNGTLYIDHIKDLDNFYKINDDGKILKLDYEQHIATSSILW